MDQPRYFRTLGHEQVTWTKLMVCVEKIYNFSCCCVWLRYNGQKAGQKRWMPLTLGRLPGTRTELGSRQFWQQHCLFLALIQSFRKSNLQHQALHWNAIMHCNRQSQGNSDSTACFLLSFRILCKSSFQYTSQALHITMPCIKKQVQGNFDRNASFLHRISIKVLENLTSNIRQKSIKVSSSRQLW